MRRLKIKHLVLLAVLPVGVMCRGNAEEMPDIGARAGDSGFASILPGLTPKAGGGGALDMLRGLSFNLGSSLFYDSNVGQSPDTRESPAQDDLVLMISPGVQWVRTSSSWDFALGAQGSYGHHFEESEYDSKNYNLNGSIAYHAGRWDLGGSVSHSFNEGINRFYGGVVSQSSFGFGLSAAYEISPKTSLDSSFNTSWSQPDGGLGGTKSQSGNLSAMWRYSSLLRFGPGLGFAIASGDLQPTRNSWGPTLSVDYKLSRKVNLSARGGLDFVSYEGGGSDHAFSAAVNASYALNAMCRMNLSLSRGVQADASLDGAFREGTGLRFSVDQKIGRRLRASLGIGYEHTAYLTASGTSPRAPLDYYTGDFSLSMPILSNRGSASVFVRYSDSASDDVSQDWNSLQTGVAIMFTF